MVDSVKALLNVESIHQFMHVQAELCMREHAHRFPYDSADDHTECLKRPSDKMNDELRGLLQEKMNTVGVKIIQFSYTNVTYKESMERTLLAQQEANAMLLARDTIVKGVTGIAITTLRTLEQEGVEFSKEGRTAFVANMHYLLSQNDEQGRLIQLKLTTDKK